MKTYCDGCGAHKACKPAYLPDMGGMEGYFCAQCVKHFKAAGEPVKMLPIYG